MRTAVGELRLGRGTNRVQAEMSNLAERSNADLNVPMNLCEWVPASTLVKWIQEEIVADAHAQVGEWQEKHRKNVLRALAFAYAQAEFDSQQIDKLCQSETFFQMLCEGESVWSDEIAHLRRKNRGFLVTILARVLGRVFKYHFGIEAEVLPTTLRQRFYENAVERLDIARHLDVANAD